MGVPIDAKVSTMLQSEEGFRAHVYDDATGLPVTRGSTLKGHPTVGYGVALDVGGITDVEAQYLLSNRIGLLRCILTAYPWFTGLDIVRQHAVMCMAYQLGAEGVRRFSGMCAALLSHDYDLAAQNVTTSIWATQTPARAQRVAAMILTGQYAVI